MSKGATRLVQYLVQFLVQLAGFILGGIAGLFGTAMALWLAFGAPSGEKSAIIFGPMLLIAPVGAIIGGVVGMKLAGRGMKACMRQDSEPAGGGTC